MQKDYLILILGISIVMVTGISAWTLTHPSEEQTKLEAQKIIDFRNTDYSCNALGNFYLNFYSKKGNSFIDTNWYIEARSKLITTECISNEQLSNLEFIDVCMDGSTVGCEISKLENPELYENFNFKSSVKEIISQSLDKRNEK